MPLSRLICTHGRTGAAGETDRLLNLLEIDESLHFVDGYIPFLQAIRALQMNLSHVIPRKMFAPKNDIVKLFEKPLEK